MVKLNKRSRWLVLVTVGVTILVWQHDANTTTSHSSVTVAVKNSIVEHSLSNRLSYPCGHPETAKPAVCLQNTSCLWSDDKCYDPSLSNHPPGHHSPTPKKIAAEAVTAKPVLEKPEGYGHCGVTNSPGWPRAKFLTSKGELIIELRPDLAPHGVHHFTELVRIGYYNNKSVPFGRVNKWATQFGADERETRTQYANVRDFPNRWNQEKDHNPCADLRWPLGMMAMLGGPHTLLVREPNNGMGHNINDAPAGYTIEGLHVLKELKEYNDEFNNPVGGGPKEASIFAQGGMEYLRKNFPDLDYIISVTIEPGWGLPVTNTDPKIRPFPFP
eukprot:m.19480 g.19480  ORF g.19480 m.19480 type:complete len:329 (+) comp12480_c0_seq1:216-1202(+)